MNIPGPVLYVLVALLLWPILQIVSLLVLKRRLDEVIRSLIAPLSAGGRPIHDLNQTSRIRLMPEGPTSWSQGIAALAVLAGLAFCFSFVLQGILKNL